MKPHNLRFLFSFLLLLSFFPARSQYRLLVHDKLHNSYNEYGKHDKYTVVTSDSILLTGFVTSFNKNSISLLVKDSTHVIQLASIINLGLGTKSNKAARVTTRIIGFVITTLGAMFTISALESFSESDNQTAAVVGVASVAGIAAGVLMIRASYKNDGNNRDFLVRPRYSFRVVQSTF